MDDATNGLKPGAPIVLPHRPRLDSRKKVADYTRTYCADAKGSFLRAFFVDENCSYLKSALLACSEAEIRSLDGGRVIDAACLAGATGVILARGVDARTADLSHHERENARRLHRLAEVSGIHLLDYIVVEANRELSPHALEPADRI